MRLIDADKLKEDIKENGCDRFETWDKMLTPAEYETFVGDVIDNAPTVNDCPNCEYKKEADYISSSSSYKELINLRKFKEEYERPHGKWVIKQGEFSWWHICSNCKEIPLTSGFTNQDVLSNFCPNCGADMREDSEA